MCRNRGAGTKLRPVLILKQLPKYNDFLVCGISSQTTQYTKDIDEILREDDINFKQIGLHKSIPGKNTVSCCGSSSKSFREYWPNTF